MTSLSRNLIFSLPFTSMVIFFWGSNFHSNDIIVLPSFVWRTPLAAI